MQLTKNQLNNLGTAFGLIAGISTVLGSQHVINEKTATSIGAIATGLLGLVVQYPASDQK